MFVKVAASAIPFCAANLLAQAIVDFTVYNESSYQKTFTFIDEGNNSHAVITIAAGKTSPLRLLRSSQGFGSMRYNSNMQPKWTHVGFIKAGQTVNLY
jgi:hypothetical protein